jgi:aminoglycoside N3'-acetyltransferase
MRKIYYSQLIEVLESLRIQAGDNLLIHSALQFLGQPVYDTDTLPRLDPTEKLSHPDHPSGNIVHNANDKTLPGARMYFDAICHVIRFKENPSPGCSSLSGNLSSQGTLAVPTFNFGFTRGEGYDPLSTPSQGMGAFSEFVRQLPEMQRTPHPMQSLAVTGKWAGDLVARDTPSAFDKGSAFERMLELEFKLVLLGADIQAVSMVHYSEQRAQVPYRFWKDFTGPVNTQSGKMVKTYRMFVRDLTIDPRLDLSPIQNELDKRGLWQSVAVNYGNISTCRLSDFVRITDELLSADPWILISNRPATPSYQSCIRGRILPR